MRSSRLLLAVAIIGLASACTTATAGQPASPTTTSDHSVPTVDNPLNASRFLTAPCEVLSAEQRTQFKADSSGEPHTTDSAAQGSGPYCDWTTVRGTDSLFSVGFVTKNSHGLSDLYRGRKQFAYFEKTEVDGYPGVFADAGDGRAGGSCQVFVGISDSLTFRSVEIGRLDAAGSCGRAVDIARAVLMTLKGEGQ